MTMSTATQTRPATQPRTSRPPAPTAERMGLGRDKDPVSGLPVPPAGIHPVLAYGASALVTAVVTGLLYLALTSAFAV
jgi:hypothetical protein